MVKIKEFVQVAKQIAKPQSPGSRGLKKNKEGSVRYFSAGMKKQTRNQQTNSLLRCIIIFSKETIMAIANFSSDDQAKIKQIIQQGTNVKQEVQDLNDGLRDTVKAVALELNIKPAVLMKAINVRFKDNAAVEREDFEDLEVLLDIAK